MGCSVCIAVRIILFVTVVVCLLSCLILSCLVLSTGAVVPLSKLSRPMTGGWVAEFVRWGSTDSMGRWMDSWMIDGWMDDTWMGDAMLRLIQYPCAMQVRVWDRYPARLDERDQSPGGGRDWGIITYRGREEAEAHSATCAEGGRGGT